MTGANISRSNVANYGRCATTYNVNDTEYFTQSKYSTHVHANSLERIFKEGDAAYAPYKNVAY